MNLNISNQKPEIYERLVKEFGINWDDGVIITYGDTVYCKFKLPAQKVVHESVHIRQQSQYGVKKWWDRYIEDKEFRLQEEVEAYSQEAEYLRNTIKDKNYLYKAVRHLAMQLSSSMYGSIISPSEALKLINGNSKK